MKFEFRDKTMEDTADIVFQIKKYQGKAGSCVVLFFLFLIFLVGLSELLSSILSGADVSLGTTMAHNITSLRYQLFVTLLRIEAY